jgi:hypothetical protein
MDSQWKAITLDAELSHPNGTKCSFGELQTLETERKTTRQWKSQTVLMLKTEISTCLTSTEELNNNGISSMSRTGRVNQPPVNGIETGASLSTKISILFLLLDKVDILITSITETLSSRLKTVEQARNGTSINLQELSEVDQSINPSISTTPENLTTCNTTAPAPTGGRCLSIRADTSPTCTARRSLPYLEDRIKKPNQFGYGTDIKVEMLPKSGELLIFTS